MTPIDPSDEDFDVAHLLLNDGLKSCRAIVSNYRALLAGDGEDNAGHAGFTHHGGDIGEQPAA